MYERLDEKIDNPIYNAGAIAKSFFADEKNQLPYISVWNTSDGLVIFVDESKVERAYMSRSVSEHKMADDDWNRIWALGQRLTQILASNGAIGLANITNCVNLVPVKYWNGVLMTSLAQPDKYLTGVMEFASDEINKNHKGKLFQEVLSRQAKCIYESNAFPAPRIVVRALPRAYQFEEEMIDGIREILEPFPKSGADKFSDLCLLASTDEWVACSLCKCVSNMRQALDWVESLTENCCSGWQDWVFNQFRKPIAASDGTLLPMFVIEDFSTVAKGIKTVLEPDKLIVSNQEIIYSEIVQHRYNLSGSPSK